MLASWPSAEQAELLLAAPVAAQGQPGWPGLRVATHILGATVTGQIASWLREAAGRAREVRARLTEPVPGTRLLILAGSVPAGEAAGVLRGVTGVLRTALRDGFSPAGLADAVSALAFETAAQVAAGLPAGYPARLIEALSGLTAEDVTAAYRRYLDPGQLRLIAFGDPSALAGPLRKLGSPATLKMLT